MGVCFRTISFSVVPVDLLFCCVGYRRRRPCFNFCSYSFSLFKNHTKLLINILPCAFYIFHHTWSLHIKCPYSELLWSIFSHIRTEYVKMRTRITPNTDTFYAVYTLSWLLMILEPRSYKRLVIPSTRCKSLYILIREKINSKDVTALNNYVASRFVCNSNLLCTSFQKIPLEDEYHL